MDLNELQTKVDQWIKENGVRYFDEMTNTVLLMEEIGELSRLMARKYGEQSFKKEVTTDEINENIGDEIGDIFFVLTCLANQMGYSLDEILEKNFDKKTDRDQYRHKANKKLKSRN